MSAENIRSAANVLEGYAMAYHHVPIDSGYTDENGDVTFSGLETGLYLASGKKMKYGNYGYRPSPVLVEVIEGLDQQTIFPKFYQTSVFAEINTSYEVRKVWVDNNDAYDMRPVDITVDIYKDGEYFDTVVLNEEKNWEYRWVYNDPLVTWQVIERKIPRKYVVSVDYNSKQYLIKNSYNPDIAIDWDDDEWWVETTTATATDIVTTENTQTTAVTTANNAGDKNTTTTDFDGDDERITSTSATAVTTNNLDNSTDTQTTSSDSAVSNYTDTNTTTVSSVTTVVTTIVGGGGDSGGGSGGGGLPQTGQLWWPVIPLSLGGILFIFIGIKLKPQKENNA